VRIVATGQGRPGFMHRERFGFFAEIHKVIELRIDRHFRYPQVVGLRITNPFVRVKIAKLRYQFLCAFSGSLQDVEKRARWCR
jgi:hypothetical protein